MRVCARRGGDLRLGRETREADLGALGEGAITVPCLRVRSVCL